MNEAKKKYKERDEEGNKKIKERNWPEHQQQWKSFAHSQSVLTVF